MTSISTMRQRPTKSLAKPGTVAIRRFRDQLGQPHQSAGGGSEGKGPFDATTATEAGLLLLRDCLDPVECLLDPLANARADGIAAVPVRSPVNRRSYGRWCSAQHAAARPSSAAR